MEDKIFNFAIVVSLLIHIFAFASLFYSNFHYKRNTIKNLEVIYQITKAMEKVNVEPVPQEIKRVEEEKKVNHSDSLMKKLLDKGNFLDKLGKKPDKFDVHQKEDSKIELMEKKKQISVPLLKAEKISNPKYLNYHERVRNKIKNRAYFYVDDPKFQSGEVYLTFVIASDGSLKAIKIIDSKTNANDYLRSVGLRSIKESSPFPAFPDGLKYPELSFNIIISFEVGD